MTEPRIPNLNYRIDYFFLDAPLTATSSTLSPDLSAMPKQRIQLALQRLEHTWGKGLLELLGLLGVINEQGV